MKDNMKTLEKIQVEKHLLDTFGISYTAENKLVNLPIESFFDKTTIQKFFGLAELRYVEYGFDCEDWADMLRQTFKTRYYKTFIHPYVSRYGASRWPGIFCECAKVIYPDENLPRWFVCILVDDGYGGPKLIFRERINKDIVIPKDGWKLLRLK
jgi:hypothetical protein